MLFQRDSFTGSQIHVDDAVIADLQHESRTANHAPSAKSKAPKAVKSPLLPTFTRGDIVFLKDDNSKHKSRERYMVTSLDREFDFVNIQKLLGSKFQSSIYPVRPSEIYHAPVSSPTQHPISYRGPYDSDHESVTSQDNDNATSEPLAGPYSPEPADSSPDSLSPLPYEQSPEPEPAVSYEQPRPPDPVVLHEQPRPPEPSVQQPPKSTRSLPDRASRHKTPNKYANFELGWKK